MTSRRRRPEVVIIGARSDDKAITEDEGRHGYYGTNPAVVCVATAPFGPAVLMLVVTRTPAEQAEHAGGPGAGARPPVARRLKTTWERSWRLRVPA
jgi:hypothetical protein